MGIRVLMSHVATLLTKSGQQTSQATAMATASDNANDDIDSSSDNDVQGPLNSKWKHLDPDLSSIFSGMNDDSVCNNTNLHAFNGPLPGQTTVLNAKAEPIDLIDLFLDQAFIDMMCMETNYYATQTFGQPLADDIKFITEELKAWQFVLIINSWANVQKYIITKNDVKPNLWM